MRFFLLLITFVFTVHSYSQQKCFGQTLYGCGSNFYGQLGQGKSYFYEPGSYMKSTDWKMITASEDRVYGIKDNGSLWTWGTIPVNNMPEDKWPKNVDVSMDWEFISNGVHHKAAIKTDGSLWTWGENLNGELGYPDIERQDIPKKIDTSNDWKVVSCGCFHTIAIKNDGTLWGWGSNLNQKLGVIGDQNYFVPIQIGSDNTWKAIECGNIYNVALKEDGSMWGWGVVIPSAKVISIPTQIGKDKGWKNISNTTTRSYVAVQKQHCFAIDKEGSLWGWGNNQYGQLGDGTKIDQMSPKKIGYFNDWVDVSAGTGIGIGIRKNGSMWSWGRNYHGVLGDGTLYDHLTPRQIGHDGIWKKVFCSGSMVHAIKEDGSVWSWGKKVKEKYFTSKYNKLSIIGTQNNWKKIYSNRNYTLGIKASGSMWGCGLNEEGQLSQGKSSPKELDILVQIGDSYEWDRISCGVTSALALRKDGSLWTWGKSGKIDYNMMRIGDDNDWKKISSGSKSNFAIKKDGSLWSWGNNIYGQLGTGSTKHIEMPTRLGSDKWIEIACGQQHSLGIKEDGSLWTCGSNSSGKLGINNLGIKTSTTMTQVGNNRNWISVCAALYGSFGIQKDGSLWSWGEISHNGEYGSLPEIKPTLVLSNQVKWKKIACSSRHVIALKEDGSIWVWGGDNEHGQTCNLAQEPTQIGKNTIWMDVAAGYNHSLAIKDLTLSIDDNNFKPLDIQVSPMPIQHSAKIKFDLYKPALVSVSIVDMMGLEIMNIENSLIEQSVYNREFEFKNIATGIYMLIIQIDEKTYYKKIIVLN